MLGLKVVASRQFRGACGRWEDGESFVGVILIKMVLLVVSIGALVIDLLLGRRKRPSIDNQVRNVSLMLLLLSRWLESICSQHCSSIILSCRLGLGLEQESTGVSGRGCLLLCLSLVLVGCCGPIAIAGKPRQLRGLPIHKESRLGFYHARGPLCGLLVFPPSAFLIGLGTALFG